MSNSRLEAFSDGVLAIIITIMILELKVPQSEHLHEVYAMIPEILAYALSFAYVAIYWNNHHHLVKSITFVNPKILWSNMFFLFCISFIPWATGWMDKFYNGVIPVMTYCFVLLMTGVSYYILQNKIKQTNVKLEKQLGVDIKGKVSLSLYLISILVAPLSTVLSLACVILVAIFWMIPDKRIEQILT